MAQIPKGRLVKGPYEPRCIDCAIYFSITVSIYLYLQYTQKKTNMDNLKLLIVEKGRKKTIFQTLGPCQVFGIYVILTRCSNHHVLFNGSQLSGSSLICLSPCELKTWQVNTNV